MVQLSSVKLWIVNIYSICSQQWEFPDSTLFPHLKWRSGATMSSMFNWIVLLCFLIFLPFSLSICRCPNTEYINRSKWHHNIKSKFIRCHKHTKCHAHKRSEIRNWQFNGMVPLFLLHFNFQSNGGNKCAKIQFDRNGKHWPLLIVRHHIPHEIRISIWCSGKYFAFCIRH